MGANDRAIEPVDSTKSSRDTKKGEAATAANLQQQQPHHMQQNNPAQHAGQLHNIKDTVHISGD
jgi:hypothetical protein